MIGDFDLLAGFRVQAADLRFVFRSVIKKFRAVGRDIYQLDIRVAARNLYGIAAVGVNEENLIEIIVIDLIKQSAAVAASGDFGFILRVVRQRFFAAVGGFPNPKINLLTGQFTVSDFVFVRRNSKISVRFTIRRKVGNRRDFFAVDVQPEKITVKFIENASAVFRPVSKA